MRWKNDYNWFVGQVWEGGDRGIFESTI